MLIYNVRNISMLLATCPYVHTADIYRRNKILQQSVFGEMYYLKSNSLRFCFYRQFPRSAFDEHFRFFFLIYQFRFLCLLVRKVNFVFWIRKFLLFFMRNELYFLIQITLWEKTECGLKNISLKRKGRDLIINDIKFVNCTL